MSSSRIIFNTVAHAFWQGLKSAFGQAMVYALDTIAPPDPLVREIECMSQVEFERKISPCAEIESTSRRNDGIIAFFPYRNDIMRKALVELKDFRNKKIEKLIGTVAYARLVETIANSGIERPLLVPVPMTKKALRARGWNQCELIAREISNADEENMMEMRTDVIYKIRDTGDQVGRTREERLASLESCMIVADEACVRGRNVIVLDDIVTTGATLAEAKRALLQAGARAVICVAVAF